MLGASTAFWNDVNEGTFGAKLLAEVCLLG